jgi:hypothetical protein
MILLPLFRPLRGGLFYFWPFGFRHPVRLRTIGGYFNRSSTRFGEAPETPPILNHNLLPI